jgi:hypothetical protein
MNYVTKIASTRLKSVLTMSTYLEALQAKAEMEDNIEECEFHGTNYYKNTSTTTHRNYFREKKARKSLQAHIEKQEQEKKDERKALFDERCPVTRDGEVVDSWEQLDDTAPDTAVCPICLSGVDTRLCKLSSTNDSIVLQVKCCKREYHASCLQGLRTTSNKWISQCPSCRGKLFKIYSDKNRYFSINKLGDEVDVRFK